VGAFSDMPCNEDPWRGAKALERCESCDACLKQCPTGAITRDRFLLDSGRCLTYYNEGTKDFPEWIDPAWHHCLIGCMRCQSVCPENKGVRDWIEERVEFSEPETNALVDGVPLDELPDVTAAKVRSLEISELYRLLCRNLGALIGNV
jgi:epoxyqueuosine reductase